ncbi:MAG: hypothetical protein GX214_02610 [Clostridiales bacterium]|nr:hypothetical protein [Clostridiales bacterium]
MSTFIFSLLAMAIFFSILIYIYLSSSINRIFNKYFELNLDESYNLDDLFYIKLYGEITPKVDFLEIPYKELNIEINKKTIRGNIINNKINLELVRASDRKTSISLIKEYYIKSVKTYIKESIKEKQEYIQLIKISERQKKYMKKLACQTCKHKMQCQISFTECNYERKFNDKILDKGMKVDNDRNYKLNTLDT